MNPEIMMLLRELAFAKKNYDKLRIAADILAEAGLIANTPHAKFGWSGEYEHRPEPVRTRP